MESIAKAVIGSKVKQVTKGIGDAVGCDENMSAAETEASSQRASDRKKEERDHQKKELHQYKKAERQDIRDKYQLKSGNSQAQNSSSARKQETESKSCSIS